jgi:UDP-glucose 4-epimerase
LIVNDVNSNGTVVVLDAARRRDVDKVVVASSSSIYGDTPKLPKKEDMKPDPKSPYAASKLSTEHLAHVFYLCYGIDTVALRYFNVYGPRQRGGSYAGVISRFIKSSLSNKPLIIEGDGRQTRDFTYVADVVQANLLAVKNKLSDHRVFNIGSSERVSIFSLAEHVIKLTNSKSEMVFKPPRKGDVLHSLADISMARAHLGYEPTTFLLKTGLKKTIKWMKAFS